MNDSTETFPAVKVHFGDKITMMYLVLPGGSLIGRAHSTEGGYGSWITSTMDYDDLVAYISQEHLHFEMFMVNFEVTEVKL